MSIVADRIRALASRGPEPAAQGKTSEIGTPQGTRGEKQTAPQTTRDRDDVATPSTPGGGSEEPGTSHDATPECAHGVSREYNCLLCIAEEHGHAAAVKAIVEWIRNPHEGAENHWTPSWVADAIERGEPFRPRAGK